MSQQYVVMAAGHALYGPFPTAEAARDWALHPNRTADVRFRSTVVPLFGGALLDDDEEYTLTDEQAAEIADYGWRGSRRWTGVGRP